MSVMTYQKLVKAIPGFDQIMAKVQADADEKAEKMKARRAAQIKAKEDEKARRW